jgi:ankyrin repeat protein
VQAKPAWIHRMLMAAAIFACILLPASGIATESSAVNEQLLRQAETSSLEEVKTLLAKGGDDLNAKNMNGHTALKQAVFKGHLEVVKFLIDRGADVNIKDECGETAFMKAATMGDLEIEKFLISKGAAE